MRGTLAGASPTLALPGWWMQMGELTPLQVSHVVPYQFK